MHYLGENASGATNSNDGTGTGMRLGFGEGTLDVALSLSRTRYFAGNVRQINVGGRYDFGVARLMGQYTKDQNDGAVGGVARGRSWLLGAVVPVGIGEVRVSYSQYRTEQGPLHPATKKLALGYVHYLSKRTALYVTYARLRNSDGAAGALSGSTTAPNASSSGQDFGVRHTF